MWLKNIKSVILNLQCFFIYISIQPFQSIIILDASVITSRVILGVRNSISSHGGVESNSRLSRSIRSDSQTVSRSRSRTSWRISSTTRPLYKLYLPFVISETLTSEEWDGAEAVLEYKPDVYKLENITRAKLNLILRPDAEGSQPVTLLAGHSSFSTSAPSTDSLVTISTSVPHPANRLSFDVLHFIRNVTREYLQTVQPLRNPVDNRSQLIKLIFKIRRSCNMADTADCGPILDVHTRLPFLKVDYTETISNSEDSDIEDLFTRL